MAQQTRRLTAEAAPDRVERVDPSALNRNELRSTPGLYRRAWRRYRRNKIAMVALFVFVLIVLFVLSADMLSRYVTHVTYWKGNLRGQFLAPFSEGHFLGTDSNGRDVLTRLAYGGRVSLLVAGLAVLTTLTIGSAVGAIAGYFGGFLDSFLMRLVDVLLAIPGLPLLILIFALYRPNAVGLAIVLGLLSWAGVARLIRGEVLSIRGRDYVDAARVIGASNGRIIWRHIFPNIVPIIVVWISLAIPSVILAEAALSYLGFGVQVPTPSWGNMLQGAKDYYTRSWTNVFIPGFMIYITVLAINLVGNGLRDALDPRLND
ncbi:MAG: ABC transporter permease [Chloroflexota bacterium]|nr:ABC transporter permease [Chloroflexota bacterium]